MREERDKGLEERRGGTMGGKERWVFLLAYCQSLLQSVGVVGENNYPLVLRGHCCDSGGEKSRESLWEQSCWSCARDSMEEREHGIDKRYGLSLVCLSLRCYYRSIWGEVVIRTK